MPRPATGQVLEKRTANGVTYALRFRAYGQRQYVTLGSDGWTRELAEEHLLDTLAAIRLGIWQPPRPEATRSGQEGELTFHEFASEWMQTQRLEGGRRGTGMSAKGTVDLEWRLSNHLLPYFAQHRLSEITVEEVDRYRGMKVREARGRQDALDAWQASCARLPAGEPRPPRPSRPLSAGSVNKTLITLAAVLETAVEYGRMDRNPARGRRRRLAAPGGRRPYLDRADHIGALLDAAGALDGEATHRKGQRRALLASLLFAGLRIGEALELRWRDVDLARSTITVRAAKTEAGERVIDVLAVLRDELDAYRSRLESPAPEGYAFATGRGGRESESNVRQRVLAPAVDAANAALATVGTEALPERLTPHSLRHTFASILVALGEDPAYVMGQMGHTDPHLTLRIYAKQMGRRDGERERLRALVQGGSVPPLGTECLNPAPAAVDEDRVLDAENPAGAGLSREAAEGIRTLDLLHGKQTL